VGPCDARGERGQHKNERQSVARPKGVFGRGDRLAQGKEKEQENGPSAHLQGRCSVPGKKKPLAKRGKVA